MDYPPSAWHKPAHDATMEQYLSVLDTHGVQFAVLAAASIYGNYSELDIDDLFAHFYTQFLFQPHLSVSCTL